jgi:hypothetical protein
LAAASGADVCARCGRVGWERGALTLASLSDAQGPAEPPRPPPLCRVAWASSSAFWLARRARMRVRGAGASDGRGALTLASLTRRRRPSTYRDNRHSAVTLARGSWASRRCVSAAASGADVCTRCVRVVCELVPPPPASLTRRTGARRASRTSAIVDADAGPRRLHRAGAFWLPRRARMRMRGAGASGGSGSRRLRLR